MKTDKACEKRSNCAGRNSVKRAAIFPRPQLVETHELARNLRMHRVDILDDLLNFLNLGVEFDRVGIRVERASGVTALLSAAPFRERFLLMGLRWGHGLVGMGLLVGLGMSVAVMLLLLLLHGGIGSRCRLVLVSAIGHHGRRVRKLVRCMNNLRLWLLRA